MGRPTTKGDGVMGRPTTKGDVAMGRPKSKVYDAMGRLNTKTDDLMAILTITKYVAPRSPHPTSEVPSLPHLYSPHRV